MRVIACVTTCLVPILAAAAQMAPQTSSDRQAYCVNRSADFYSYTGEPCKSATNSDRAIAGKQTGALLPCQERSASHRTARSNYPLKTPLFPRPPRLAADARPQPSARNVRFGSGAAVLYLAKSVSCTPASRPLAALYESALQCQNRTF